MNSIMKMLMVIICDSFILIRNLFGNKIAFHMINLVSPFASIRTYKNGKIKIGRKTTIRINSEVTARDGYVGIGDNCFINRNCMIVSHKNVTIKNGVTIGPGTVVYDHDHNGYGGYNCEPVIIDENVWIGAGCIVLKGVRIGKNSIIGAGCLISKNIPSDTVVYQKRLTIKKRRL